MKNNDPSPGLLTITELMEIESKEDMNNILDTIHFKTTQLHGRFNTISDVSCTFGNSKRAEKLNLSTPFFTSRNLFMSIPHNAKLGIALGLAISGAPVTIYEDMPKEMDELIRSYKPRTVYCFGPNRKRFDNKTMKGADLIQIEPIDGSLSLPQIIPELRNGKDVIKLISLLKELVDAPVIYSIDPIDVQRDIDFVLVSNVDSIMVVSTFSDLERRPDIAMVTSLIRINRQMDLFKNRENGVKVIAHGPFRNVDDILKTLALGADAIGLDSITFSFLRGYLTFKTGEKDIINDDIMDSNDLLDWAEIGELYGEFLIFLKKKIEDRLMFLNIDPEKNISMNDIDTSDYNTASITGLSLQGFGGPVPIWRHRS